MVGQTILRRRRPFGVRLYLAFAFAGVALITAGLAYLLVSETGEEAADERLGDIASGRTSELVDQLADRSERKAQDTLDAATQEGFSAWVFDDSGELVTGAASQGVALAEVDQRRRAV